MIDYKSISFLLLLTGGNFCCKQEENYTKHSATISSDNSVIESPDSFFVPKSFGFGRKASRAEIVKWDIDISPDGKGLPPGIGWSEQGKRIYDVKCIACHGPGGVGGVNGSLVASIDTSGKRKENTIGSYWPFATTIFDYIRRSMPFNAPGSLSDQEVYHLTAYLLHANKIIEEKTRINATTLPNIVMPSHHLFIPDDRTGGKLIK